MSDELAGEEVLTRELIQIGGVEKLPGLGDQGIVLFARRIIPRGSTLPWRILPSGSSILYGVPTAGVPSAFRTSISIHASSSAGASSAGGAGVAEGRAARGGGGGGAAGAGAGAGLEAAGEELEELDDDEALPPPPLVAPRAACPVVAAPRGIAGADAPVDFADPPLAPSPMMTSAEPSMSLVMPPQD